MNEIINYILNLLIDEYFLFLESTEIIDQDFENDSTNFDALLIFYRHFDKLTQPEIIDSLYTTLGSLGVNDELEYSLEDIIFLMCYRFQVYHYQENDQVKESLEKCNDLEALELFLDNDVWAQKIIYDFLDSLANSVKWNKKMALSLENHNLDNIKKWQFKMSKATGLSNDELRNNIGDLFNYFVYNGLTNNGLTKEQAIEHVWYFFQKDFDPLNLLDGYDCRNRLLLKYRMLCIMLADVYEFGCNKDNFKILTDEEKQMVIAVILSIQSNVLFIFNGNMKNILLEKFLFLNDFPSQRVSNRIQTYNDNRIFMLKKVNPSYEYDELTF